MFWASTGRFESIQTICASGTHNPNTADETPTNVPISRIFWGFCALMILINSLESSILREAFSMN